MFKKITQQLEYMDFETELCGSVKYALEPERIHDLTIRLVNEVEPFIYDGKKFDDDEDVIKGLGETNNIYVVSGLGPLSDIGRSIEAEVYRTDKRWEQPVYQTEKYHEGLEAGATFLLFVDTSEPDSPKAIGSIRVNSVKEPQESGTLKYYKQAFPDGSDFDSIIHEIPKCTINDVVDLAVLTEYRGIERMIAPWLYHALYRKSGTVSDKWISCINDHAAKQLGLLGIKFARVTDKKATYDGDDEEYGFYADAPSEVRENTINYYLKLARKKTDISRLLASAAMISAHGRLISLTDNSVVNID